LARDLRDQARTASTDQALARALGWFSVGLGLTELLAPRQLARTIGVPENSPLLRVLGARELANGLAILADSRPSANWLNARVAGDVVDLGLLGLASVSRGSKPGRVASATAAVLAVTALDVAAAKRLGARQNHGRELALEASVQILRPAEELYRFWRDPSQWSRVFSHVTSVVASGSSHVRWQLALPGGHKLDWASELSADIPGRRLVWRSVDKAPIASSGFITFDSLGEKRGTLVRAGLRYEPPSDGVLARSFLQLFRSLPEKLLQNELRRFKQLMETGEIATTEGQPAGRRSALSRLLPG